MIRSTRVDRSRLPRRGAVAKRDIAVDSVELVSVAACEGRCGTPLFDRMREAAPRQFPAREVALADGRTVGVRGFSMMLGGWGVTAI